MSASSYLCLFLSLCMSVYKYIHITLSVSVSVSKDGSVYGVFPSLYYGARHSPVVSPSATPGGTFTVWTVYLYTHTYIHTHIYTYMSVYVLLVRACVRARARCCLKKTDTPTVQHTQTPQSNTSRWAPPAARLWPSWGPSAPSRFCMSAAPGPEPSTGTRMRSWGAFFYVCFYICVCV